MKNKQQTLLPRLFLISSGEERIDKDSTLLNQLNLLPRSLSCMIQIREKQLDAKALLILAQKARAIALPEGSLLMVNERVDIALAAGLDGVHLPENACSARTLRTFAPDLIYGRSIHSSSAMRIAENNCTDYLVFGPVFETPSKKKFGAPQGLEKLGALCRKTALPVFALGGITPQNASLCLAEGAYGIAALSVFREAGRFVETIEKFYLNLNP